MESEDVSSGTHVVRRPANHGFAKFQYHYFEGGVERTGVDGVHHHHVDDRFGPRGKGHQLGERWSGEICDNTF
jgi:hypothetical protein